MTPHPVSCLLKQVMRTKVYDGAVIAALVDCLIEHLPDDDTAPVIFTTRFRTRRGHIAVTKHTDGTFEFLFTHQRDRWRVRERRFVLGPHDDFGDVMSAQVAVFR